MLQTIRDRLMGKVAMAILGLIALTFVFFGLNFNFATFGYAAKVDGEEISVAEFENAYRNQLLSLAEQGTEVPEDLRSLVRDGVLDRLIRQQLIDSYLDDVGFEVSDRMVTDFIQQDPTWQVDGEFSREAYYLWLEQRAIEPGRFEAVQRRTIEQFQLERGVAATAFVTPAEYRRYLNLYAEQRQVEMAAIDINAIMASVEITDADITEYYEARPGDFQAPESVDVAYVELRRDEIAEQIEIGEDELAQYYEDTKSRYAQDEQRRARHILIQFGDDEAAAESEAEALAARVRAGEPFEDLAQQYSDDGGTASQGGDLGLLLETQLPEGLGDAVFSMQEGEIAGPVRSEFGFHIVRLDDVQSGGALPLDQVRNELLRELRLEKSDARYLAVERQLSDALFDAATMEALAEASGLELKTAEGFTREGGAPFGTNQAAIDAIYDPRIVEERQISDIVELDANRAIVVTVTDYHEASRRPLEEVRDEIASVLQSQRAFEIATNRVTEIESALAAGTALEEAVAGMDHVTTRTATVTRQSTDIGGRVLAAIFQQRKPAEGQARVGTAITADQRYVVFNLVSVTPGRPESIPLAERDAGKEQLGYQSGTQDYASLVNDLEQRADIVKSEDVISRETLFE